MLGGGVEVKWKRKEGRERGKEGGRAYLEPGHSDFGCHKGAAGAGAVAIQPRKYTHVHAWVGGWMGGCE